MTAAGRRRVGVVTGTRADYGLLAPVIEAIGRQARLEAMVFATGMHLDERFGRTIELVRRDHAAVVEVPARQEGRTGADMARGLAQATLGFVEAFERLLPDAIVVLGDRAEAFAAALAAAHMRIVVAHVHGGDVTRCGIDDSIRHALTQLAHLHFPATAASAERIRRMGQPAWRIHSVGSPSVDALRQARIASAEEVLARVGGGGGRRPYAVVLHHPDTTHPESAGHEVDAILAALAEAPVEVVALYPNSDAGHRAIVERLDRAAAAGRIRVFPNLERPIFLGLLRGAAALVGNSSAGIIEGAALGVPFVEVGTRQAGRDRGANVLPALVDSRSIRAKLLEALDEDFRLGLASASHPYGDGRAGERIAAVLASISIDERLLQKDLEFPG